jgi:bifunctional DNA-binding transcriptional regulator/antitoxin component of YhaV-PrlF toxin-antitoxin module
MAKKEKIVRKLTKTGRGSMYVVLPKEHIRNLGWRERQRLALERVKGGILVKDARSRK